jgi:hypothetical protein
MTQPTTGSDTDDKELQPQVEHIKQHSPSATGVFRWFEDLAERVFKDHL